MNKKEREAIALMMKYEMQEGEHTYSMCECKRHSCRNKCWECLLDELVEGKPIKENKQ